MEIQTLLLILVVVWGTGMLFRWLQLPVLLGELLAGLIFGPAAIGLFQETETIKMLAELGIFFLMLHAGLETNPRDLLTSSKTSMAVAAGGIAVPMLLGYGVAKAFGYNDFTSVFIGMSLSITAIPVTIKVFKEFNFAKSKIAHLVMGAAIADDIAAFIVLSVLLGIVEAGGQLPLAEVLMLIGKVVVFFGGALLAGTKLIPVFKSVFQEQGYKAFTFTLIIALAFGVFAEWIGLHYILGVYLGGLFVKEEVIHPDVYRKIEDRLFAMSYSFLGPIFFVSLGFHVDFGILKDPAVLPFLGAILVAAIVGKMVGAGLPAYLAGHTRIESLIVGTSMNARGSVELIVALIGLELGLIDKNTFSVLIFMAFLTTLMAPISLKFLLRSMGKKEA